MANFNEVFTNRHTILPVVHVVDQRHTIENTHIARDEGCDGVFLISMGGLHHQIMLEMQNAVKDSFPDFWIGANFWDLEGASIFKNLNHRVDGVWTNNAQIDESTRDQFRAEIISESRKQNAWDGLYFGGVALKHQASVSDYALAARIAKQYMDVVITSGVATESVSDVEKIQVMKEAIGDHPLGIASGISPENVHEFKHHADVFLVASSLLIPGTERFDRFRVIDLVSAVRSS